MRAGNLTPHDMPKSSPSSPCTSSMESSASPALPCMMYGSQSFTCDSSVVYTPPLTPAQACAFQSRVFQSRLHLTSDTSCPAKLASRKSFSALV